MLSRSGRETLGKTEFQEVGKDKGGSGSEGFDSGVKRGGKGAGRSIHLNSYLIVLVGKFFDSSK